MAAPDDGSTTESKFVLPLILIAAAVIRVIGLGHQSLSVDECLEIDTAQMTVAQIVQAPNSFPPLYHLLLNMWLGVESSDIAVRTFSVVAGMLSVGTIWKLVSDAIGKKAGVIAAGIAAISPFHVYYSQQGRVYMLFLLLSTLAMYFGLKILRGATVWDRSAFVIVGVVGGYTHYYFAVVLLSIGLGVLAVKGPRFFARQIIPLAIIMGVLCGPLWLLLQGDLDYQRDLRASRPASIAALGYTVFSFQSGYTLGASRSELHWMTAREAVAASLPWIVVVGALIGWLMLSGAPVVMETKEAWYWISLLVVPFVIVLILCRFLGVTYNTRFLVFCWVPFCLVIAAGLNALRNKAHWAAIASVVVISAIALFQRHYVPKYQNEDVRAAADFLNSAEPRPVLVCAGYMDQPLKRYLQNTELVVRLDDRGCAGGSEAAALLAVRDQRSFWLVYCREFHGDPDGMILQTLQQNRIIQPVFQAAGIRVFDGRNPQSVQQPGGYQDSDITDRQVQSSH